MKRLIVLFPVLCFLMGRAQGRTDAWLQKLLLEKGSPLLRGILAQPDTFRYQVIYTRIDRDAKGKPHFTNFYLNVDKGQYFNPASTVKLPVALAALEKMNGLKSRGIDKYTPMLTDSARSSQQPVLTDTSSADGLPSVAQYIRKIFLVSDNDAYNRLYEFVGQESLNRMLQSKDYRDVRITRRFVPMTEEENRYTNPVRFVRNGKPVYSQPEAYSRFAFSFGDSILIGRAHYDRNDSLVLRPMDFTHHNNLPLADLQQLVQSVLFPASVPAARRFRLTPDDYRFLYRYMSMLPSASRYPNYDTTEYFDSYAKFFFKANRGRVPSHIRIFNKPGWSYGFLTDAAYVADTLNRVEFMLCAVIYVNADGVLNDNKYEYEQTGYPFFHDLFDVIYRYELTRKRAFRPNFDWIRPD